MTLYAATSNPGKLAEFTAAALPHAITVLPLPGLATLPEPVEDAPTFLGNAELKARAYSLAAPGLLVFADDSGLEVAALNGTPGVRSARFADDLFSSSHESGCPTSGFSDVGVQPPPPGLSKDARNNYALLQLLGQNPNRSAQFTCALALARDGQILLSAFGSVPGQILPTPRGTTGFGYDPLFLIPSLGQTMAELHQAQKWNLSHRGNAFRDLLAQIANRNDIKAPQE